MRGWRAVLVVAVLGLAAPAAAQAAPQVTVTPDCEDYDYGFAATLSGFPANSSVGISVASDSFDIGPVFFETDATGGYSSSLGGPPFGMVTVHAFADLDGDQAEDPGEPAATGTLAHPCEDLPLPGGTVSGTAQGSFDAGSFHLDLDAHGDPNSAAGTVTDTRNGVDYQGVVTCVGLRRLSATVGVRFPGGGPGGRAAEIIEFNSNDDGTYFIGAAARDAAPGPGDCPLPGTLDGVEQLQATSQSITVAADTPDTTPPVLHGLGPLVVDATTRRGAYVRYRRVYATDDTGITPTVQCTPAGGTRLPVGGTRVRCTATDRAGNTATGSFQVQVLGARGQIREQFEAVHASGLAAGWAAWLERPLRHAARQAFLHRGRRTYRADRALRRFGRRARRLAGHGLTAGQATRMVLASDRIRTVLGDLRPPHGHGARLVVLPACDEPDVDIGSGGPGSYGVSMELVHGDPSATIGLDVYLHGASSSFITLDYTSDSRGHLGPIIGALPDPVGDVKVVAFRDEDGDSSRDPDEPVIAQGSVDDPCVAVPRPAPLW